MVLKIQSLYDELSEMMTSLASAYNYGLTPVKNDLIIGTKSSRSTRAWFLNHYVNSKRIGVLAGA